jgi:diguanylate cyclase (GGDEF)-like protein/PAS domain S-box-containing protein
MDLSWGPLRRPGPAVRAVLLVVLTWAVSLLVLAGTPAVQHVSNVGLAAVALLAGAAALRRARRDTGSPRLFWGLLGAAVLSWATGQVVWTWYESVLGQEVPFPSPADLGYLALPPLAAAALLSLPLTAPTLAGRVRTILDGLVVASSLLLCSWLLVLGPAFRAGGDDVLTQAISLAYPVGDVAVITIVIYSWSRSRQLTEPLPVSLPLVGTGLVAFAVSDSGFTYLTTSGSYSSGSIIDIGWFAGFALLLLAALRRPAEGPGVDPDAVLRQVSGNLLPYAAVTVALLTSVLEFLREGYGGAFTFWVRTTIMVLLVVRQILTLRENQSLTRGLEGRVQARTVQLRASEQRFAALVQHSSDLVTVVDRAGTVSYQSRSSERILGHRAEDLLGTSLCELMDDRTAADFLDALQRTSPDSLRAHSVRSAWRHATGRECQVEVTITDLLDDPAVGGLVLNTRDVTDRVRLEEQLTHQAFTDSLTGLPNRALFKDRLQHALSRRTASERALTVFFLDLDGFKAVNDTLGHSAGDVLLVEVARRLSAVVRPSDTVARFGGDEFAVMIDDLHDGAYAAELAQRIVERLEDPVELDSEEVHATASIGIAALDAPDCDAEQLLRNADLAMYQAKAARAGSYAVYHPGMHVGLVERVRLEADLRRALGGDQLFLHYQPMVAMETGRITGVEALVRWQHPERGVIAPDDFIPLAEGTGLIREIGLWVLREACRQAVRWEAAAGSEPLRMSVNLSAQQILQQDLVERVAEVLAETGLSAGRLTLEMTESALIDDSEQTLATLLALRAMGIRLSIDDFGTGYSSLSYLHRFPIDTLKIDRSFVQRLSGGGDAALVDTILGLAASLQMETVAEGVEDPQQLLVLQQQGCTTGQGYHFSPPVTGAAIEALLAAQVEAETPRPKPSPPSPARAGAVKKAGSAKTGASRGGGRRRPPPVQQGSLPARGSEGQEVAAATAAAPGA